MHRITTTSTTASKPAASVSGTAGYFWPGDIPSNSPSTQVTYDWLNSVQEEISYVIESPLGGNLALNLTNDTQLLVAIQAMIDRAVGAIQSVPVATVFYRAQAVVPGGYLLCDGSAVSRTTYAALFAAIGTTYGAGNGSTTFNLPDLRGVFPRGVDLGRGLDPSRAMGSYQADLFGSHNHSDAGHTHADAGHTHTDAGHAHSLTATSWGGFYQWYPGSSGTGSQDKAIGSSVAYANIQGSYANIQYNYANIQSNGGVETRPKNVALYPIIKF